MLKSIASIFSPLRILPSAAVSLKMVIQKMCKEGNSCDDGIKTI